MPDSPVEHTPGPPHKSRPNKFVVFILGFLISLAIGRAVETVTDREFLEDALKAQTSWIEAAEQTSPIALAGTFWDELVGSMTGHKDYSGATSFDNNVSGDGILAPVAALFATAKRFFVGGGLSSLLQLALGALAVAAFNQNRTKGKSVFFDNLATNLVLGPVAIVACASLFGLVLWGMMLGALHALNWVTGMAAAAAGATGVAGFCWYCVTKLGEKGVEHAATPMSH